MFLYKKEKKKKEEKKEEEEVHFGKITGSKETALMEFKTRCDHHNPMKLKRPKAVSADGSKEERENRICMNSNNIVYNEAVV